MSIFRCELVLPSDTSMIEQIDAIMQAFPFVAAMRRHNESVESANPAAITDLFTYRANAREALVMAAVSVKRGQPVLQTVTRNLIAMNMYGKLQLLEVAGYVMVD